MVSQTMPPPLSAVLTEIGFAIWSGTTGSCADGLGHSPVNGNGTGTSSGTRYTIVNNPGASFDVNCTPSALATKTGMGGLYPAAAASVRYQAVLTPVEVTVSGVTRNGGMDNALVGQGLWATIAVSGFTVSNYRWQVSGAIFKSVEYGGVGEAAVQPPATYRHSRQIIDLLESDFGRSSCQWYWEEGNGQGTAGTEQVLCTVDVSVAGIYVGTGSAVRDVGVWTPWYAFAWDEGYVEYVPGNTNPNKIGTDGPGLYFVGTVTTPSFFGVGRWAFAQTCDLYRNQSGLLGWRTIDLEDFYLDNSWPYTEIIDTGGESSGIDSPDQYLLDWANHIAVSDEFRLFEIYMPPTGSGQLGSEWVSLHLVGWHWEGGGDSGPGNVWSGPNGLLTVLSSEPYRNRLLQWEKAYPYDY